MYISVYIYIYIYLYIIYIYGLVGGVLRCSRGAVHHAQCQEDMSRDVLG